MIRTAIANPILVGFIYVVLRVAGSRTLTQAMLFNKCVHARTAAAAVNCAPACMPQHAVVCCALQDCAGGHRQPCGVGVPEAQQSPGSHMVVATLMIVGLALLIDAAYAYGLIPGAVVHARPILLYANGEQCSSSSSSSPCAHCRQAASAQQHCSHTVALNDHSQTTSSLTAKPLSCWAVPLIGSPLQARCCLKTCATAS